MKKVKKEKEKGQLKMCLHNVDLGDSHLQSADSR